MTTPRHFATHLRRNTTEAERKLWYHLRRRGLNGFRFVRQVPIGPFIVDFLCRERRLIIEVDGATHGEEQEIAHDLRRTLALRRNGFAVYRVDNGDVYENIEGVLDSILLVLEERPAVFESSNRRTDPLTASRSSPNELGER